MAIPAVISAISSISQASSANAQNQNQAAWNRYNAQMGYNTEMASIAMQVALGLANAKMAAKEGEFRAAMILADSAFNQTIRRATTEYNDLLIEDEIRQTWDAAELDVNLLRMARAQERGEIEAQQSASGTVMGEGSNAEVLINQKTQEQLEAFIIMHQADRVVTDLQNTRAQNLWQGEVDLRKIIWEGKLNAMSALAGAGSQAAGMAGSALIGGLVNRISAENALNAGMHGAQVTYTSNKTQINNNLSQGLLSAAGRGVSAYYQSLAVDSGQTSSWTYDEILKTGTHT